MQTNKPTLTYFDLANASGDQMSFSIHSVVVAIICTAIAVAFPFMSYVLYLQPIQPPVVGLESPTDEFERRCVEACGCNGGVDYTTIRYPGTPCGYMHCICENGAFFSGRDFE